MARTDFRRSPSGPDSIRRARPAARSRADRRPPRTRTAGSAQRLGVGDRRSRDRSGRSRRRRAAPADRSPPARPRCGAVLVDRRAADLHLHDVVAAVEIAAHLGAQRVECPCRDSSSRPRHRRRRADWPRGRSARRAAGTAACRRSSPPRPRPPCRCVPTATERSPCPPGFSLVIIAAQIRCGSRLSPSSSSRLFGSASRDAARKRSRIRPPWP